MIRPEVGQDFDKELGSLVGNIVSTCLVIDDQAVPEVVKVSDDVSGDMSCEG
jgi:hypothetical protein